MDLPKNKLYTFEDWIKNKFVYEKDYLGNPVLNDSENYLSLVGKGKLTYETVDTIQEEQSKVYEKIVKDSLIILERNLQKQIKNSLNFEEVLRITIKKTELYFAENEDLYYEILKVKKHRGIKYGAKFITSNQYLDYLENHTLDFFIPSFSNYGILENNETIKFPTTEQSNYWVMEINILWSKRLNEIREQILNNETFTQPTSPKQEQENLKVKPFLKSEIIEQVYDILKDFFNTEQQGQLFELLKSGNDASQKLLFNGNGNKLTDTFKKLIEYPGFIYGLNKSQLQLWIVNNFKYKGRKGDFLNYKEDTVRGEISTDKKPCKYPIIEIKNGLIFRVINRQKKEYNNY